MLHEPPGAERADGIVAADSITQQVRALDGRFGVQLGVDQARSAVPQSIDCLIPELEKRLSPRIRNGRTFNG